MGLTEKAGSRVRALSGGQQRRVDLALGLVGDPELVFLDEPTTGFDPSARRGAWEVVTSLRGMGKTVLLTTHYMDEAQHLADRVAVMAGGSLVALGPPDQLGGRDTGDRHRAVPAAARRVGGRPARGRRTPRVTAWCSRPTSRRRRCTASPAGPSSAGIELPGLTVSRPVTRGRLPASSPPARTRRRVSDVGLARRQVVAEQKGFWRNPAARPGSPSSSR